MFSNKNPKNHSIGIHLPQERKTKKTKINSPLAFEAFELNEIEEVEVI